MLRVNSQFLDSMIGAEHKCLDKGFIRVVDYMGDQSSIVQAARVSYGNGTKSTSEDRALLRYMMRMRHSSPLEMCELKIHVKLPIFVARQWIRHRMASVNELSARYSVMKDEFYIPDHSSIAMQATNNKQGRGGALGEKEAQKVIDTVECHGEQCYQTYSWFLEEMGVARELSRVVLPTNIYTEWYWKIDLHNLLHFLSLRMDQHAQYEIRVYADMIGTIVQGWLPDVWEAFRDYRLEAVTLSGPVMESLRRALEGVEIQRPESKERVSDREWGEFLKALGK
jgi:thymidylate synthase (FAD)